MSSTPVLYHFDITRKAADQTAPAHNRWHPEIPAVATAPLEETFRVECQEATDGQIRNDDDPSDVRDAIGTFAHPLSGPFHVDGAEPGDLVATTVVDLGPFDDSPWGYSGIFLPTNGGGFLSDVFPTAHKAIWDLEGEWCVSRHIPGVRFKGLRHPGVIGCAPSAELLASWNAREQALARSAPEMAGAANLPTPENACLGAIERGDQEFDRVASDAARTTPPREHGGNLDVKDLRPGTTIFLPVYVPGALLSVGDLHFSQGDGEIAFCGGIEIAGWIDLRLRLVKDGMRRFRVDAPVIQSPPPAPAGSGDWLMFSGVSVDDRDGSQHFFDASLAFRRACLATIDFLTTQGFTREQAYLLLTAIPIEGRIGSIVNRPNACCTVALPLDAFDRTALGDLDALLG